MPQQPLTSTLAEPGVVWTIAGVGAVLVVLLLRELPKIPRQLLVLMAAAFVDMLGVFLVVPLVPFYGKRLAEQGVVWFGEPLGAATITGLVMSTFTIAQSLSAPVWGRFSDRAGRRPALMVALGASAAGYVIFGFADSLWLLLLSRIVQGAGGGTVGVIQSYVADAVPPEERARALGWLSAATNLGVALGPVLGSGAHWLGEQDLCPGGPVLQLGHTAPGLAAAAICLWNLWFAWRHLPESHHERAPHAAASRSWSAALVVVLKPLSPASRLLVLYAIAIGAGQGINSVMALLLNANFAVTEHEIGTVYTYIGAISVFARVFVLGRMLDVFGEARLSRIGTVTLATGLFLLPAAGSLGGLALAVGLLPLGTALTFPCVSALLSRVVPPAERGLYLGLQQTYGGFARILAPNLFAFLYDHHSHGLPFLVASIFVAATLPLGFGLHRYSKQKQPAKPA